MNRIEWSGEFVETSWPAAATALVVSIVNVFLVVWFFWSRRKRD